MTTVRVVHVDDVPVERMDVRDGWAISEFRLPVSSAEGSSTTMFHARFRPGSKHAKHRHRHCDELTAYLSGVGVGGQGDGRREITAGTRRLIPRGSEHFFWNGSDDDEALVVGFYVGVDGVEGSGYEHCGEVLPRDVEPPFKPFEEGTVTHVSDVPPAATESVRPWRQADVRVSIGRHTGSEHALLDVALPPGAALDPYRFRTAEQLYLVTAGEGVLRSGDETVALRAGHAVFVPPGEELAVANNNAVDALRLVGLLTGAGGLDEAGCAEVSPTAV